MLRLLRVPSMLLWLTCLWVALWGQINLGNIVAGFLVAITVVAVARPTGNSGLERTYFRPLSVAMYLAYFLWELVKSSLVRRLGDHHARHPDPPSDHRGPDAHIVARCPSR